MLTEPQTQIAQSSIRVSQIIAGAIIIGALFFAGMILLMFADWQQLSQPLKLLATLAAASTLVFLGLAFVVPSIFPVLPTAARSVNGTAQDDQAVMEIGRLLNSQITIRYVLLDVCVFANALPMMFEPRWINIGCVGLAVLVMLLGFPRKRAQQKRIERRFADWQAK